MYVSKATVSSDMYIPNGPKPVFIRQDDIRNFEKKPVTGEELYISVAKVVKPDQIAGIQEIRALWRIYLLSREERVRLITEGLEIRGALTPVYDTNPFTRSHDENLTRVVIKDVPLSVSDDMIRHEIQSMKHEIKGDIIRQKLRVNGQLTNCLNGDRVLFISPPSQPIPRKIVIGKIFRARVYHDGQPTPNVRIPTCSRCLETGHHVSQCNNALKCQLCRKEGHMKSGCPGNARVNASTTDENNRADDETHIESNSVRSNRRQTSLADFLPRAPTPSSENDVIPNEGDRRGAGASTSSTANVDHSHSAVEKEPTTNTDSEQELCTEDSDSESDRPVTSPEMPIPPKRKLDKKPPKKKKTISSKRR